VGDTVRVRTKASSPSGVVERSVRKRREEKRRVNSVQNLIVSLFMEWLESVPAETED